MDFRKQVDVLYDCNSLYGAVGLSRVEESGAVGKKRINTSLGNVERECGF